MIRRHYLLGLIITPLVLIMTYKPTKAHDTKNGTMDINNEGKDADDDTDIDHAEDEEEEIVRGIVFGRSVRSFVCYLYVAVLDDGDDDHDANETIVPTDSDPSYHITVEIIFDTQDFEMVKKLRSHFRRFCRLGDLLALRGIWSTKSVNENNKYSSIGTNDMFTHLIVSVHSIFQSHGAIKVSHPHFWNMRKVQSWQQRLYFYQQKQDQQQNRTTKKDTQKQQEGTVVEPTGDTQTNGKDCDTSSYGDDKSTDHSDGHGHGVVDKGLQANMVVNFIINMVMNDCDEKSTTINSSSDPSSWAEDPSTKAISVEMARDDHDERYNEAIRKLNEGSGVLDVAGGSGFLSMALGMRGIKSTVVDPRESVGKLPGRARKIWRRALRQQKTGKEASATTTTTTTSSIASQSSDSSQLYCYPIKVTQYDSYRAWFGQKPSGVEEDFRNTDKSQNVPVLNETDELLKRCSCIVALHPDEATDFIFDQAIKLRKRFVVVPCCVFARIFPSRRIRQLDKPVSTFDDLLKFQLEKSPTIKSTRLPFDGKNTVLWSSTT